METVKHTPGPWIVIDDVQLPSEENISSAKHIGTFNIKTQPLDNATIGLWLSAVHPYDCIGFTNKDTAAANAKLMAAAPELLEALRLALPYIEGAYECAFPDGDHNENVLNAVKAAIAKATT